MEEIYKDVLGYEGIYQVSNLGNVKSLKFSKEKILKPYKDTGGYLTVDFNKNNRKTFMVHKIVATAFLGVSDLHVNHKNSDRNDNRLENLEYVNRRENNTHRFKNKNTTSKFTGVCWDKSRGKWFSSIKINGKRINLGRFNTELEAHNAYLKALEENNLTNKYA